MNESAKVRYSSNLINSSKNYSLNNLIKKNNNTNLKSFSDGILGQEESGEIKFEVGNSGKVSKNPSKKSKSNSTSGIGFTNLGQTTMSVNDEIPKSDDSNKGKNFNSSKNNSKSNKKEKKELTRKQKSAKKTRIKNKFVSTISVLEKLIVQGVPVSIVSFIRKAKLELIELDINQQKAIINMIQSLSKEELALILLLIPKNSEELTFLKEIFFTRQFMDILFKNINTDIID